MFILKAPSGSSGTFVCKSGNAYSPNANGLITSVAYNDLNDLENAGCFFPPDIVTGKSNLSAATDPVATSDSSKGYGVGSVWINTTAGKVWECVDPTASAAVWNFLGGSGLPGLPWVTGRFYGLPGGVTPVSFLTVASTLYAYPILVPKAATLAALQASVITGQTGGLVELGLYADNGSGYPGALVAGTDTGDLDGTGTAVVGPTNLAVALSPGWYWAAIQAKATSTMPSVAGSTVSYGTELGKLIGFDSAAHLLAAGSQACMGIKKTSLTYAALLATFPAGAAPVLNAGLPLVSLGV